MNNATQAGRRIAYRTPDMEAFDRLPKSVRFALANAAFSWSANWCLNQLRRGLNEMALISAIVRGDSERIRKDEYKVWNRGLTLEDIEL
jgi:hypothetical protein